jgi:small subunit ribosomal protein S4e
MLKSIPVRNEFLSKLGSFDIAHMRDAKGNTFCTRMNNVFVIGDGKKTAISLPKGKGIARTVNEERDGTH